MKKQQSGFTLIELMIVVAIIGILASIALPAYKDYTTRAKISEAIIAASAAKSSVSEYYISQGRMPDDQTEAGFISTATNVIQSVSYAKDTSTPLTIGIITTSIKKAVSGETADTAAFTLTGTGSESGVSWSCATDADTPLDAKYLPANCR